MDSTRTIEQKIKNLLIRHHKKKNYFWNTQYFQRVFFFSIVLGSLQKTEFLLSDSVVIFCIIQYFFHIPLFFDFDHQKHF